VQKLNATAMEENMEANANAFAANSELPVLTGSNLTSLAPTPPRASLENLVAEKVEEKAEELEKKLKGQNAEAEVTCTSMKAAIFIVTTLNTFWLVLLGQQLASPFRIPFDALAWAGYLAIGLIAVPLGAFIGASVSLGRKGYDLATSD
jgi:hypothetical protein